MVDVYLGADSKQWLANEVLRYSILSRTQAKVVFHDLAILDLEEILKVPSPSFLRWFIPHFQKYKGKAIYLDLATLVLDDIENLFNFPLDNHGALACPIDNPPGTKGFRTNVMLLDCEKLTDWKPDEWLVKCAYHPALVAQTMLALPNSLNHKDFGPLSPEWNVEDSGVPPPKILHFKNPQFFPWLSPAHPQKNLFLKELRSAVEAQQISLRAILLEMQAGRIYSKLLEDMMDCS